MIYVDFKKRLLEKLEIEKDLMIVQEQFKTPEALFEIKNADDKLYMRILQTFELIVLQNVEWLLSNLCAVYGIEAVSEKYCDLQIRIGDQTILLVLKSSPLNFNSARLHRLVEIQADSKKTMWVVFLLRDTVLSKESLLRFERSIKKINSQANIQVLLFEELLETLFGYEERTAFLNTMKNFKEEMHQAVGYQITEICSLKNKQKLKKGLLKELGEFDFSAVKKEKEAVNFNKEFNGANLDDKIFSTILNRFNGKGLYKVLVGNSDFSECFLTSEWLYRKYFTLEDLDNTFIVAGYLKSVEQLLWNIVKLLGKGRKLKNKVIIEENYDTLDKTLGSLEYFFEASENKDLFGDIFGESKDFVVRYLKSQISDWRVKNRNGYLHKQRLNSREIIENIRKETIYLYMLILGSIDLSEENIKILMN